MTPYDYAQEDEMKELLKCQGHPSCKLGWNYKIFQIRKIIWLIRTKKHSLVIIEEINKIPSRCICTSNFALYKWNWYFKGFFCPDGECVKHFSMMFIMIMKESYNPLYQTMFFSNKAYWFLSSISFIILIPNNLLTLISFVFFVVHQRYYREILSDYFTYLLYIKECNNNWNITTCICKIDFNEFHEKWQ